MLKVGGQTGCRKLEIMQLRLERSLLWGSSTVSGGSGSMGRSGIEEDGREESKRLEVMEDDRLVESG